VDNRDLNNESFIRNSSVCSEMYVQERILIRTKTSKPVVNKMTKETLKVIEDWYHIAIGEDESNRPCFHRDMAYYMDMLNRANANDKFPGGNLSTIARNNPSRFFTLMRV
jgi:hypothetical protein